jgi:hypothetical protein
LWVRLPPRLLEKGDECTKVARAPRKRPGWVRFPTSPLPGRMPEWLKGAVCNTAGSADRRFESCSVHCLGSWSNGTTPVRQTGNPGSIPGGSTWKVAGYGWPGRSAKAVLPTEMRVRLPCLPLDALMVKRTIIPRFERGVPGSNPGRGADSPVVQRAGHSRDMGKIAGSNPAGTTDGVCGVAVGMRPCEGRGGGFDSPRTP